MKDLDFKQYFKGKKITLMGLGLLGRGVGDALFLVECGAELTVTDLKDETVLAPSLEKLKSFSGIKYTLGRHDMKDFEDKDFILKAAGVPLDSPYIAHAKESGIPIEMDASLFIKLAPKGLITVGITGTRGKSTVTHLIAHILKIAGKTVLLGGNIRDKATLPLLKEAKDRDYAVLELDSWQLQGFGDSKISPHIAVFTTFMPDHLNYYKNDMEVYWNDKANIFKYQNSRDNLILGEEVAKKVASGKWQVASKIQIAKKEAVPKDWKIHIPGEHNLQNISCAIEACRALGMNDDEIRKGVESFKGVEGRLQFVKEVKGVKIWNDNNSTTPEATIAALKALGKETVLIMGGADKGLDMMELLKEIPVYTSSVVLLPGTGSEKLVLEGIKVNTLEEAVKEALKLAKRGNNLLFSPAFASFGPPPGGFKNEYDRNDQFMEIISRL